MDRAEATGLGVATAGHLAILAALTFGVATTRLPVPKSAPIEVAFVEEVGLETTAPTPSAVEPAPLAGPENGPPVPAMPAPPEVQQVPAPQPQPQPQPRAVTPAPKPVPAPKPAPGPMAQPRPATPKASPAPPKASPAPPTPATSRRNASGLSSVVAGLSDRANPSQATNPPAAATGTAVQASLGAEVRRQLKPHWKAPTGADAEQLRTEVVISLAQDGRVTDIDIVGTTGQTASNRPQVPLHREQAERAVRLAAPFKLPAQYYDSWKSLRVTFDKRLSQ
ncbi:MAG TPA: TonB C-terminal domain-containing protein [Allosphingosinicella sp.]|nr:TonB C-terminal domain-containing protein [Allosphingosinicella sp.]